MFIKISLATESGSFVVAMGASGNELRAESDGVGAWESFRLFNRTRPGEAPRHGDQVVLQAWTGRFVAALDNGGATANASRSWVDDSTIFELEKARGDGAINSGDRVALKTKNGHYLGVASTGGIDARGARRDAAQLFSMQIFQPLQVRLRSADRRYVSAENGGGGQVTANRSEPALWETFSLVNMSRSDREVHAGDVVALQVFNGKFIRSGSSAAVDAGANRATQGALFLVRSTVEGPIGHRQTLSFQSASTLGFLSVRDGVVRTDSTREIPQTSFRLELSDAAGMRYSWLPDGQTLAERPFKAIERPLRGVKKLLVLHLTDESVPPLTASNEHIREAVFGDAPSLSSWFRAMSGGACTVESAGVFGPIRTPRAPTLAQVLTAAEQQGVPLRTYVRDGVIDGNEVGLLRIGYGAGGQAAWFDETSAGGIRYRGPSAGIGVSLDVDEGSRMVIAHEVSHMFMDVIDRYGARVPLRGDIIANRTYVAGWEGYTVERQAGSGPLLSGDTVMLRAHDGQHLSPSPRANRLLNLEGPSAGESRSFVVSLASGGGQIASGSRVTLRSSAGHFMTAELGGNNVVTVNRPAVGAWESFEMTKLEGSGPLASGDVVSLRTLDGHYLAAETAGRSQPRGSIDTVDERRGYSWLTNGDGMGGGFDNSSANYSTVLLSLYDRIRIGWVTPRVLTPDQRGCYLLQPFLEAREALILFDPQRPSEWYTVENRQRMDNEDEVPSSGLVISWVNEDRGYWEWWFNSSNDPEWEDLYRTRYPAVISAAAPGVPPNPMALPLLLTTDPLTKRHDPGAAFTNQEWVLPLGNGDPSRFHISCHASGRNVALCIR
jgi:Fascin domain